ncbi:MAG: DUF1624 domain-containing protein [Eubacterium sp.]|nr:DUF1624 domain-containing protein [Eubacterium sp.]
MKEDTKRIEILDELRGFAILAMIVHHTFLDIGYVLGLDWGYNIFDKLCILQPLFWAIFIVISGICSRLSRNTVKRGCIVFAAGLIVTLVTAVIMPKLGMTGAEIYFGILSCLGACMIITGLLMPLIKKTPVAVGVIISIILFAMTYSVGSGSLFFGLIKLPAALYKTNYLAPLGFYNSSFKSADYFSLFPWLFMFLFGAFIGKYAKDGAFPAWTYKKHSKPLAFIGRNSLWFYLAHQPVIYGILYAVSGIIIMIYKYKV